MYDLCIFIHRILIRRQEMFKKTLCLTIQELYYNISRKWEETWINYLLFKLAKYILVCAGKTVRRDGILAYLKII